MSEKRGNTRSFIVSSQQIFSLLSAIPYLLAIYVFTQTSIKVTPEVALVAVAALLFHLLGYYNLRRIADQMSTLSRQAGMAASEKKNLSVDMEAPSEIGHVAERFNGLLSELNTSDRNRREVTTKLMIYAKEIEEYQEKLKHEALVRERLGRYVGGNVVEHLLSTGEDVLLKNQKQTATILFADIRSFTRISESMQPEMVITMLNEYFDAMVNIIFKHNGILDKFIGDELMAVFGLVGDGDHGSLNAVRCAMEMRQAVHNLMLERNKAGLPVFEVGIGINTGEVVVGSLGSKNRMDYTVIGDTVNVASRLVNITGGQQIVTGEKTFQQCESEIPMQPREKVTVKNRTEPVMCYEVTS